MDITSDSIQRQSIITGTNIIKANGRLHCDFTTASGLVPPMVGSALLLTSRHQVKVKVNLKRNSDEICLVQLPTTNYNYRIKIHRIELSMKRFLLHPDTEARIRTQWERLDCINIAAKCVQAPPAAADDRAQSVS